MIAGARAARQGVPGRVARLRRDRDVARRPHARARPRLPRAAGLGLHRRGEGAARRSLGRLGRLSAHVLGRRDAGPCECRLAAHRRVGHELPDILSTAAGDGDLGSPPQRLLREGTSTTPPGVLSASERVDTCVQDHDDGRTSAAVRNLRSSEGSGDAPPGSDDRGSGDRDGRTACSDGGAGWRCAVHRFQPVFEQRRDDRLRPLGASAG